MTNGPFSGCLGEMFTTKMVCLTTALMLFLTANAWSQATETVLYSFSGFSDGANPNSPVIFDSAGNLYGTTYDGGTYGNGTAYELMQSSGSWTEAVLYSFVHNNVDGFGPAGVSFDGKGDLCGTASFGGTQNDGTVFELSPSNGTWVVETFIGFNGYDGQKPSGTPLVGTGGILYGTTYAGGAYSYGTVFEISRSGAVWTETPLYFFTGGSDGAYPNGNLLADRAGNLYGTTPLGGANGYGTVFELSPVNGGWTEKVLYSFAGFNHLDGENPENGLVFDKAGNLYGTTNLGGTNNVGTAFELKYANGGWTESVIHNFNYNGVDGNFPSWGLATDKKGNFYGTTAGGGAYGYGTVFRVYPSAKGWSEQVIYSFCANGQPCSDGLNPSSLTLREGNIYGPAYSGGGGYGVVYEIIP